MTTIANIATKARALIEADSTSYPDAELAIDLNVWYHKIATMILDAQDESDFDDPNHGDYPKLTFPLVAGQRDYAIAVAEKVLKIKRLDITYNGSDYYRAEPIDTGAIAEGLGNDTVVDARFSKTAPKYDFSYGSLFLYPRANATDVAAGAQGIIEWERQIKDITASDISTGTMVPGIDDPWHAMLAYGAAFEQAVKHGYEKKDEFAAVLVDFEARIKTHYSRKQLDRRYQFGAEVVDYE